MFFKDLLNYVYLTCNYNILSVSYECQHLRIVLIVTSQSSKDTKKKELKNDCFTEGIMR